MPISLGPLPDALASCRVQVSGTCGGLPWLNQYYLSYTGTPPTKTVLDSVSNRIGAIWTNRQAQALNSQWVLQSVVVRDIASRTGNFSVHGMSYTGINVQGMLPNNCAVCISFTVNYSYRGGHPRMYVCGLNSTDTTNGHSFQSSFLNEWANLMTGWMSDHNTMTYGPNSFQLQMVSYYTHDPVTKQQMYHPGGPKYYPITGYAIHPRVDSMRRRLGKDSPS